MLPGLDEGSFCSTHIVKPFFTHRKSKEKGMTFPQDGNFEHHLFLRDIHVQVLSDKNYVYIHVEVIRHPYSGKQPCQNKNVEPLMKIFKHQSIPRDTDYIF